MTADHHFENFGAALQQPWSRRAVVYDHVAAARGSSGTLCRAGAHQRYFSMIDLYNASTNQLIGSITEADLKVLVDGLEEESLQDQDYYIDRATIDLLADGRATTHLVGLLRAVLGSSDGVDIRWQRR